MAELGLALIILDVRGRSLVEEEAEVDEGARGGISTERESERGVATVDGAVFDAGARGGVMAEPGSEEEGVVDDEELVEVALREA